MARPARILSLPGIALAWLLALPLALPLAFAPVSKADAANLSATESGSRVKIRFATFNASLSGASDGELRERLGSRRDDQLRRVAGIIQAVRPDVLLINEFDWDPDGKAHEDFIHNYLIRGQHGHSGIRYRYHFLAPVNTGIASGRDLDRDGQIGGPGDAWGFGRFPGQYGMLVLSRYPIVSREARTFRELRWRDMPGALLPAQTDGTPWYSDDTLALFPLSSKSHWDLPIWTRAGRIHLIAAHPTPPVFDGEEKRNSRRNFDEIRLLADHVSGDTERSAYIVDDAGVQGGLPADALFVVAGDFNADPVDGDSHPGAIAQLLNHPRIQAQPVPGSDGGAESAHRMGGSNLAHRGDPRHDTAVFSDPPGNLRVDYVLPSNGMRVVDSGVYWPLSSEADAELLDASDHRLVWIDVELPVQTPSARRSLRDSVQR
ncbi:MAG: endonuclease/exonuclease/phosphatase family protein [Xanthomonadales bacterium]|nr:endonuclease/exonuclease/phosphatase family protein [Xanthomonadales bacterium]